MDEGFLDRLSLERPEGTEAAEEATEEPLDAELQWLLEHLPVEYLDKEDKVYTRRMGVVRSRRWRPGPSSCQCHRIPRPSDTTSAAAAILCTIKW